MGYSIVYDLIQKMVLNPPNEIRLFASGELKIWREFCGLYADHVELPSSWRKLRTPQDNKVFGVWANTKEMKIVTLCEGDVLLELVVVSEMYFEKKEVFAQIVRQRKEREA